MENVAARNAGLRTHMLTTPDPSLIRSVAAPNAASGIVASRTSRLSACHTARSRPPRRRCCVPHAVADRVGVLEVQRDAGHGQRSSMRRNRRSACSAAGPESPAESTRGRAELVETTLAADLRPARRARRSCSARCHGSMGAYDHVTTSLSTSGTSVAPRLEPAPRQVGRTRSRRGRGRARTRAGTRRACRRRCRRCRARRVGQARGGRSPRRC